LPAFPYPHFFEEAAVTAGIATKSIGVEVRSWRPWKSQVWLLPGVIFRNCVAQNDTLATFCDPPDQVDRIQSRKSIAIEHLRLKFEEKMQGMKRLKSRT
jgi:hypothetical protein